MNNDGVKRGYDLQQLALVRSAVSVPVIASGGAGDYTHFADLFEHTGIDGGLEFLMALVALVAHLLRAATIARMASAAAVALVQIFQRSWMRIF